MSKRKSISLSPAFSRRIRTVDKPIIPARPAVDFDSLYTGSSSFYKSFLDQVEETRQRERNWVIAGLPSLRDSLDIDETRLRQIIEFELDREYFTAEHEGGSILSIMKRWIGVTNERTVMNFVEVLRRVQNWNTDRGFISTDKQSTLTELEKISNELPNTPMTTIINLMEEIYV